jgi:hypothetical protein
MRTIKVVLTHLLAPVFMLWLNTATAGGVNEAELTKTKWQYGLVGEARKVPIGQAFQTGITAAVLTFSADKSARIELPCRNEEVIKQVGEVVFVGTWELKDNDQLSFTVSFRGQSQKETVRVEMQGEEMRFVLDNGRVRELGRFHADTNAPCLFQ